MTLDLLTRPPSGIIPAPPEREPRRDIFIIPDVTYGGEPKRIYDHANNWITIHWWMMNRIHGAFERIDVATVHCRRYKAWLVDGACDAITEAREHFHKEGYGTGGAGMEYPAMPNSWDVRKKFLRAYGMRDNVGYIWGDAGTNRLLRSQALMAVAMDDAKEIKRIASKIRM